ncbi:MAG TPA: hypothetical protein VFP40_12395 [Terriglobales bacterium]|nr:hypothetical protein [Terriglobales bacterium]
MLLLSTSDELKLGILIAAFFGIYALSRWASRQTEAVPPPPSMPMDAPPLSSQVAPPKFRSKIVPIDSRVQFDRTKEYTEADIEPIRVTNTYFRTFDFLPGPPDPSTFADELFVECYNADTGHSWTSSYFVASPDGIRDLLDRENWQYANTGNVILVKRYDPKIIRQAVLEDMVRDKEDAKPVTGADDVT